MPITNFANLPDGFALFSLFDTAFSQSLSCLTPNSQTLTGGTYIVSGADYRDVLITASAPSTVQLPTAASRLNNPISVVDAGNNAGTNNITILPNGSEKIIGNSNYVINSNSGGVTLWPIPTGGWYQK